MCIQHKQQICGVQVEVHCHFRNQRVIDWCKQEGIHVTAYAPLSSPSTVSKMGKDLPNLLKVKLFLLSKGLHFDWMTLYHLIA